MWYLWNEFSEEDQEHFAQDRQSIGVHWEDLDGGAIYWILENAKLYANQLRDLVEVKAASEVVDRLFEDRKLLESKTFYEPDV